MLQEHKAGEKLFVDYAGQTVPLEEGGEAREAAIFVAALGASSYFYAEASRGQDLASWVSSHVRAFEYFGGVPQVVVPDNLKPAVTKAGRYEPQINRTYEEMAHYHGAAVMTTSRRRTLPQPSRVPIVEGTNVPFLMPIDNNQADERSQ